MSNQITCNDRTRTYWTPTMERFFIDLMLEHLHRGNRTGHTFNKQAWNEMLSVFNSKFASQYDKDVLKSRYTNLWKQYNDVKSLLDHGGGFVWDQNRQMVIGDESLWSLYLKVHPEARVYKTKPVLNFNDLCLIYGYTVADGRYSRSSHDLEVDDEIGVLLFFTKLLFYARFYCWIGWLQSHFRFQLGNLFSNCSMALWRIIINRSYLKYASNQLTRNYYTQVCLSTTTHVVKKQTTKLSSFDIPNKVVFF